MTDQSPIPDTGGDDVVAEPKWAAQARRRVTGVRFAVGSDLHLIEMALHDWEEERSRADTLAGEVERLGAAHAATERDACRWASATHRAETALSAMTARAEAYRTALAAHRRWPKGLARIPLPQLWDKIADQAWYLKWADDLAALFQRTPSPPALPDVRERADALTVELIGDAFLADIHNDDIGVRELDKLKTLFNTKLTAALTAQATASHAEGGRVIDELVDIIANAAAALEDLGYRSIGEGVRSRMHAALQERQL